jgi:hypothetical protein
MSRRFTFARTSGDRETTPFSIRMASNTASSRMIVWISGVGFNIASCLNR